MFDQIKEDTLYIMLYAGVTFMAMIACCYLLFRRGNAIAPDITPPTRLRRWTAAFLASIALSHLWYIPVIYLDSNEEIMLSYLIGILLDCMTIVPLAIIVLSSMLQDRLRPLWPTVLMVVPLIVIIALCIISFSPSFLLLTRVYLLLLTIGLIIYMVREVRRYGHWLRDNYADLEHKEVWQSFVVIAIILLVFGIYAVVDLGPIYRYILQLNDIVLICYLLWRVETLSDLSISQTQSPSVDPSIPVIQEGLAQRPEGESQSDASQKKFSDIIEPLLQKHCIDKQLYLQHDLTIIQLAKAIGTNRFYLSQYFSSQGTNYNAYINNLRINHFIKLYLEAVNGHRYVTAQQLSQKSGFRSYATFSDAFKRKMGQSVTAWMRASNER